MSTKRPLSEVLEPRHLTDELPDEKETPELTMDQLRETAEKKQEATSAPEKKDARTEKMRQRTYVFSFDHVAPNGKRYTGVFSNTVPSVATKQRIGILRAELSGGIPFDRLDPETVTLNAIIAHLSCTLTPGGMPEWMKNVLKLDDLSPLFALWEEVATHEATFLSAA